MLRALGVLHIFVDMYDIRRLSAGYQNFTLFFYIFWGVFFDFNGNDAFALIFSIFGDGEYSDMG